MEIINKHHYQVNFNQLNGVSNHSVSF